MHQNNQSDAFAETLQYEMKQGPKLEQTITNTENMPYFHTKHSVENYGYLPNYAQQLDSVNQMDAKMLIDNNGLDISYVPPSDLVNVG